MMSSLGGSVAKANAAKVSIIKFTQSIWIEVRGESPRNIPPKSTINMATKLTVS